MRVPPFLVGSGSCPSAHAGPSCGSRLLGLTHLLATAEQTPGAGVGGLRGPPASPHLLSSGSWPWGQRPSWEERGQTPLLTSLRGVGVDGGGGPSALPQNVWRNWEEGQVPDPAELDPSAWGSDLEVLCLLRASQGCLPQLPRHPLPTQSCLMQQGSLPPSAEGCAGATELPPGWGCSSQAARPAPQPRFLPLIQGLSPAVLTGKHSLVQAGGPALIRRCTEGALLHLPFDLFPRLQALALLRDPRAQGPACYSKLRGQGLQPESSFLRCLSSPA